MHSPFSLRQRASAGSSPGVLRPPSVLIPPNLHRLAWKDDQLEDGALSVDEVGTQRAEGWVTWIDVQGLGDGQVVVDLGKTYGLHALAVADVVDLGQRPKAGSASTLAMSASMRAWLSLRSSRCSCRSINSNSAAA